MSEETSTTPPAREWSIAEYVYGEVPPTQVPVAFDEKAEPVAPKTARQALIDTLAAWSVQYDLPFDEGDLIIDTDDDDDLRIVLPYITVDRVGDIVTRQREFHWTGSITVIVAVSGTVTASNEDEAHDLAEDALRNVSVDTVDIEGYEEDVNYEGHDVEDYDLHDVDDA
jgi:hypothetical protein